MSVVQCDQSLGEGVYFAREDYIGFLRRIVIFLVDGVVLIGGMFVIASFSLFWIPEDSSEDAARNLFLIWISFVWFYLTILKPSPIRTVGYWVTGARILTLKGKKPSVFRMTYRWLLNFLFPFNLVFDLTWSLVDSDRQTLTDRFAGTCVVRNNSQPAGNSEIHFACFTALCFCYFYPCVSHTRKKRIKIDAERLAES